MTLNSTASTAAPMKLIIPIAFKNFGIARSRLNLSAKLTSEGNTATNCRAVISERVPDKDPQSSFHGKKNSCGADFIKIRYRHVYPPANRTAFANVFHRGTPGARSLQAETCSPDTEEKRLLYFEKYGTLIMILQKRTRSMIHGSH